MRQRTVLNIFIGSPGDLEEERKAARDVIERVNHHLARNLGLHIDLRGWEDTLPGFSRPQEKSTRMLDRVTFLWGYCGKDGVVKQENTLLDLKKNLRLLVSENEMES